MMRVSQVSDAVTLKYLTAPLMKTQLDELVVRLAP